MHARNRSLCETRDQCLLFHHHAPTGNVPGTLSAKAAVWAVEGIAAFLRSGFPGRTKHSTNRAALGRGQSRSRQAARRAGPLAALPRAGWQSRLRRRTRRRTATSLPNSPLRPGRWLWWKRSPLSRTGWWDPACRGGFRPGGQKRREATKRRCRIPKSQGGCEQGRECRWWEKKGPHCRKGRCTKRIPVRTRRSASAEGKCRP